MNTLGKRQRFHLLTLLKHFKRQHIDVFVVVDEDDGDFVVVAVVDMFMMMMMVTMMMMKTI